MTDILLSIKPKYAKMIYDGTKRYEYRRVMPKQLHVGDYVYLYETSPIQAITGYFVVGSGGVVTTDRYLLWKMTEEYAGVSRVEFMLYFSCASRVCYASAIRVSEPVKYRETYTWDGHTVTELFTYQKNKISDKFFRSSGERIEKPPQSFCYLSYICRGVNHG